MHVDQGVYSVNCWLTPNSANSDLNRNISELAAGGLRIFRGSGVEGEALKALLDSGNLRAANQDFRSLARAIEAARATDPHAVKEVDIGYKQNRCVIFRSNLVHETSPSLHFIKGYRNRRINLTFMFGNSF